jgi:uncharacterized Zn finger protein (UPF0148 family)
MAPHTRNTISQECICIVVSGTVKTQQSGSLVTKAAGEIFHPEGAVFTFESPCEMIVFDPHRYQLPANLAAKLKTAGAAADQTPEPPRDCLTYIKQVTCPVCNTQFEVKKLFNSKLKLVNRDYDLRLHFDGVEPLFYNCCICPKCQYGNYMEEFEELTRSQIAKLQSQMTQLALPIPAIELEKVINDHQVVLGILELMGATSEKRGRCWLHLAWLYEDKQDFEAAANARQQALDHLSKDLYEQQLSLPRTGRTGLVSAG